MLDQTDDVASNGDEPESFFKTEVLHWVLQFKLEHRTRPSKNDLYQRFSGSDIENVIGPYSTVVHQSELLHTESIKKFEKELKKAGVQTDKRCEGFLYSLKYAQLCKTTTVEEKICWYQNYMQAPHRSKKKSLGLNARFGPAYNTRAQKKRRLNTQPKL